MQIRKFLAPAFVLGAAVLAQPAQAQTVLPLSVEARGGVVLPQGDFSDGLSTGFTVGAAVHYRIAPNVSLYGGYDYSRFSTDSDADFGGADANVTDDGFRLGARFGVPLGGLTGLSPWVEGGATLNKTSIHVSDSSSGLSFDSDRSLGYEVGAGLAFNVAPKISLTPGVRYRSHTADFGDDGSGGDNKVDANYFAIDLGVHIRL